MTIEAQEKIMQLREAALQLQEENLNLKSTNRELESKLNATGEVSFANQFYWKQNDETPFCPRCWETHKQLIHVSPEKARGYDKIRACPECRREYKTGDVQGGGPRVIPRKERRLDF